MAGYIYIYTGEGKGKTTAAIGMAIRAAGAGFKVYIAQFLKSGKYSEIKALQRFNNILIEQFGGKNFITTKIISQKDIERAWKGLENVREKILSREFKLIILDEINMALHLKLINVKEVINLLKARDENTDIVLTGRYAPQELIEMADLVTEMKEIKHYFKRGIRARKGFEY